MTTIRRLFRHPALTDSRLLLAVLGVATLINAIQRTFLTESNNYKIFRASFYHLSDGLNLYAPYPQEYFDHYLYGPPFAVVFAPFFALPYHSGLFLWHLFFGAVWIAAIWKMPFTRGQRAFACWFGLMELMTALGNSQTNPLIAAIPLFAFLSFERGRVAQAAFFIILGFNIKIYSLVAAALFLCYPRKLRFVLFSLLWLVLFTLLPLLVTTPARLGWQYTEWLKRLVAKTDHDLLRNISIHRRLDQVLPVSLPTLLIIGLGAALFCTVFIHVKRLHTHRFRMLLLSSVLLYQVVFNPAAESAAYIIAVTGVIIWWCMCPKSRLDYVLLFSCLLLTVMSATELIPRSLRAAYVVPYVLKAWPCVLIWFRVLYLMHRNEMPTRPDSLALAETRLAANN